MIFIKTFGRFTIFIDHKPLVFKNLKVKELLAFLVDNEGDYVSIDEIITTLWPLREHDLSAKRTCRYTLRLLRSSLEKAGNGDLIEVGYGVVKLDIEKVVCDYYEYIKGNVKAYPYDDEYMYGYLWAERTRKRIAERQEKQVRMGNE